MGIYERAYAKINLYLDVISRRNDGFHSLCSVMQTVGLYDGVTVEAIPAAEPCISITACGKYRVPCGSDNLAHRAALSYMHALGRYFSVSIRLDKRIPVAAGLGGGSADAAAVLRAMHRISGRRLPEEELFSIASSLGSDVPFCLLGATRLCEGRGERMRPLAPCPPLPIVILPSPERVSTPAAYSALDREFSSFDPPGSHSDIDAMLDALKAQDPTAVVGALYNIFEDVILPTCPVALSNRDRLISLGARAALMSGSGATMIGFFEDTRAAERAAASLGDFAVATTTV